MCAAQISTGSRVTCSTASNPPVFQRRRESQKTRGYKNSEWHVWLAWTRLPVCGYNRNQKRSTFGVTKSKAENLTSLHVCCMLWHLSLSGRALHKSFGVTSHSKRNEMRSSDRDRESMPVRFQRNRFHKHIANLHKPNNAPRNRWILVMQYQSLALWRDTYRF